MKNLNIIPPAPFNKGGVTASVIVSFAEKLEDSSSTFYERLAERFVESKEIFLTFAKESEKNKTSVVRTYRETITDALEAGFSFEGLDIRDYEAETTLTEDVSYSEALGIAIELEEKACKFYSDVAERSQSLLATIPRAFSRVAKRRSDRKLKLQSLLDENIR
jgi:rubrerythrin